MGFWSITVGGAGAVCFLTGVGTRRASLRRGAGFVGFVTFTGVFEAAFDGDAVGDLLGVALADGTVDGRVVVGGGSGADDLSSPPLHPVTATATSAAASPYPTPLVPRTSCPPRK